MPPGSDFAADVAGPDIAGPALGSFQTKISKTTPCKEEPFEKTGVAGMDALSGKNILTRRANQGHGYIFPQFVKRLLANQRCGAKIPRRRIVPFADVARQAALPQARRRLKGS